MSAVTVSPEVHLMFQYHASEHTQRPVAVAVAVAPSGSNPVLPLTTDPSPPIRPTMTTFIYTVTNELLLHRALHFWPKNKRTDTEYTTKMIVRTTELI